MKKLSEMTTEELKEFKAGSDELAAVFSTAWGETVEDAINRIIEDDK